MSLMNIVTVVQHVPERRVVVEVDTLLQTPRAAHRQHDALSRPLRRVDAGSQRLLDERRQRAAFACGFRLCATEEVIGQNDGGAHM